MNASIFVIRFNMHRCVSKKIIRKNSFISAFCTFIYFPTNRCNKFGMSFNAFCAFVYLPSNRCAKIWMSFEHVFIQRYSSSERGATMPASQHPTD
nr:unnamed protein product [Callosobruchus analis]